MNAVANQSFAWKWKLTSIASATLITVTLSGFSAIGSSEPSSETRSLFQEEGFDFQGRSSISIEASNQPSILEDRSSNKTVSPSELASLPAAQQTYYYEVNFAGKSFLKHSADTSERFYVVDKNNIICEVYEPVHNVISTAYTWVEGVGDPAAGDATTTQSMKDARRTYGIAADYKQLPRGTVLIVPGYGKYEVDDKCGRARQVGRSDRRTMTNLGIPRDEWSKTKILIDLRIPNLSSSGAWRSDEKIQDIAIKHGVQTGRTILKRVWSRN